MMLGLFAAERHRSERHCRYGVRHLPERAEGRAPTSEKVDYNIRQDTTFYTRVQFGEQVNLRTQRLPRRPHRQRR